MCCGVHSLQISDAPISFSVSRLFGSRAICRSSHAGIIHFERYCLRLCKAASFCPVFECLPFLASTGSQFVFLPIFNLQPVLVVTDVDAIGYNPQECKIGKVLLLTLAWTLCCNVSDGRRGMHCSHFVGVLSVLMNCAGKGNLSSNKKQNP